MKNVKMDYALLFVERLHKIITDMNMSIYHLSDLTGISQTHLRDLGKGERNPSLVTLCIIAKALDIPVSYLVDDHHEIHDLNKEEMRIIELYRRLDALHRKCLVKLLEDFVEICKAKL